MLRDQYESHPENVEGWMFGGVEHEEDRRLVMAQVKQLEAEMGRRATKLRRLARGHRR
jgi:homoserine kinase